ncbi:uncharacterized protein PHALS_12172 [Plasmopara halstedii]|uniref:Uncharacterized protein n=1 Tax=Plasmopara halstedii TaxID=4781 RepID=A0A0P1AL33_PLAHL|nr:uncharacterized protein PHALS_12172 [Plasmopara halstedii]CEG41856.1 hypothetical protein PHALS_12172 [Plasmopara halstedii]|eukprot:XP_024578225.1 hypothetical protein PHALS_12172 [Plasmopara halstedii]
MMGSAWYCSSEDFWLQAVDLGIFCYFVEKQKLLAKSVPSCGRILVIHLIVQGSCMSFEVPLPIEVICDQDARRVDDLLDFMGAGNPHRRR